MVTTSGCAIAEALALGRVSSSTAMVVFSTEPLWGAVFAYLMLGEQLGANTVVGGVLVTLACLASGNEKTDGFLRRCVSLTLRRPWILHYKCKLNALLSCLSFHAHKQDARRHAA